LIGGRRRRLATAILLALAVSAMLAPLQFAARAQENEGAAAGS
jgi:hypothetical protein